MFDGNTWLGQGAKYLTRLRGGGVELKKDVHPVQASAMGFLCKST